MVSKNLRRKIHFSDIRFGYCLPTIEKSFKLVTIVIDSKFMVDHKILMKRNK